MKSHSYVTYFTYCILHTQLTDEYNNQSEYQLSSGNHQFKTTSVFNIHLNTDVPSSRRDYGYDKFSVVIQPRETVVLGLIFLT